MGKKILIVEDESSMRDLIGARLKANGYDICEAVNGGEALDIARSENPDLILLDIMLPKLDGYKVCRMLKYDANYANIPICFLSAKSQDDDKKLADDVGADAYLTKPFDSDNLIETVKSLLGS